MLSRPFPRPTAAINTLSFNLEIMTTLMTSIIIPQIRQPVPGEAKENISYMMNFQGINAVIYASVRYDNCECPPTSCNSSGIYCI